MARVVNRRNILRGSLATVGLSAVTVPAWAWPAIADGETIVPFADMPDVLTLNTAPDRRIIDVRTIDGAFTPADRFFTMQHYGHPVVDAATFRLRVSGLVTTALSLSLDDLRRLGGTELIAGFECSGNRRPLQGMSSNGRWTGVPLRAVLEKAGMQAAAREVVFFGADHGQEDVEFRTQKIPVDQQFGRSLPRDIAASAAPFLAWALNGEPLTRHQGSPLRLIVPGWYGVSNVKWLAQIHVQEAQYLGKFQARWYRTLVGETIDGETKWVERAVTRMRLKSYIARLTRAGSRCTALIVVLHDGTPLKAVDVRIDAGPWQPAVPDPRTTSQYSWKLFTYEWKGATPGEHTLVSRVTDAAGNVQPTERELDNKKTFLEDNSQAPRTVVIPAS